jgi:hypothetical protein
MRALACVVKASFASKSVDVQESSIIIIDIFSINSISTLTSAPYHVTRGFVVVSAAIAAPHPIVVNDRSMCFRQQI